MAQLRTNSPNLVQSPFGMRTVGVWVRNFVAQSANRSKIKGALEQLPERYLKDIGWTESDIQSISTTPFSVEISEHLSIRAREQSANW